jgi:hypothetical protein
MWAGWMGVVFAAEKVVWKMAVEVERDGWADWLSLEHKVGLCYLRSAATKGR